MKMGLPGRGRSLFDRMSDLARSGFRDTDRRIDRAHDIRGVDELRRPAATTAPKELPRRTLDRE